MPRIRTVKPDLFRHEELFEAETAYHLPLRLGFIGLFTCCDREGRFRWKPRQLKLDIFPFDTVDFALVLDALMSKGFIQKYSYEGKEYGFIPSWRYHQIVNSKEQKSSLPPPPSELIANSKIMGFENTGNCRILCDSNHELLLPTDNEPNFPKEAVPGCPPDTHQETIIPPSSSKEEENKFKAISTSSSLVNNTPLPFKELESSHLAPVRVVNVLPTREARVSHALITRSQVRISFHGNSRGEKEKEGNIGKGKGKEQEIILAQDNKVAGKAENPPKNGPNHMPLQLKAISHNEVANLFDFWCQTMNQPHAKLDKPRRELILAALKMGYSVEELRTAILGCAATPFNMGQNERGELFNGLHIILRDASHIDRFIQHYHHPPFYFTPCPKRQQNIQAVQSWLAKKMSS